MTAGCGGRMGINGEGLGLGASRDGKQGIVDTGAILAEVPTWVFTGD